jgi:hypothetical protein
MYRMLTITGFKCMAEHSNWLDIDSPITLSSVAVFKVLRPLYVLIGQIICWEDICLISVLSILQSHLWNSNLTFYTVQEGATILSCTWHQIMSISRHQCYLGSHQLLLFSPISPCNISLVGHNMSPIECLLPSASPPTSLSFLYPM